MRGSTSHTYVLLPCLSDKMRSAKATNEALGEAAGVSTNTVKSARRGKRVRIGLGLSIYQALNTGTFQRDRRGAK